MQGCRFNSWSGNLSPPPKKKKKNSWKQKLLWFWAAWVSIFTLVPNLMCPLLDGISFLVFTGSGPPFIHLSVLTQNLWAAQLAVMARGATYEQTLFHCQGVYSVLIPYVNFHRIFVFPLLKSGQSYVGLCLVCTSRSTGREGLWMFKSKEQDQRGSALSPHQD